MALVVNETWARFQAALPNLGSADAALAPGASEAALEAFEVATQLSLPTEVRDWFRAHDGQTGEAGLAAGFHFLSLREVQKLLEGWAATRFQLGEGIKPLDNACSSRPPKAIQRKYSVPGWVPLVRDGEGNAIGVDLDPGPSGASGQIINFGRDEDDKYVLFPSASELLQWLASELEAGRIVYDQIDEIVCHVNGRLVAAIQEAKGL